MSKQSDAKISQGYQQKPVAPICANCCAFRKETEFTHEYLGKKYYKDKNLRCDIGGFAVRKTSTCYKYEQFK